MDREDEKILREKTDIVQTVNSPGWKHIRKMFANELIDLTNILDLTDKNPDNLVKEVGARQLAANMLHGFLRRVEGTKGDLEAIIEAYKEDFNQEMED